MAFGRVSVSDVIEGVFSLCCYMIFHRLSTVKINFHLRNFLYLVIVLLLIYSHSFSDPSTGFVTAWGWLFCLAIYTIITLGVLCITLMGFILGYGVIEAEEAFWKLIFVIFLSFAAVYIIDMMTSDDKRHWRRPNFRVAPLHRSKVNFDVDRSVYPSSSTTL